MSAAAALDEWRKQRQITDAEALAVVLAYIDNQQSPEAFADFLDNQPVD
jgi:hypothetical protein